MCYVELRFKKEQTEFIMLKRQIKNGKSFYFLNNVEVGFKEVADFLMKENIDIENNRFAILQGEIEGISLMKPKNDGLLEYLEDIIGTVGYNESILKLTDVLDKENENFEAVANAYKFTEKEYQYVAEIKEKDEETLELYLNKIKLQTEYNHLKMLKKNEENKSMESESKNARKALKELLSKNKDTKDKMGEMEEGLLKHKKVLSNKENEFLKLQKNFGDCESKKMMVEDKKKKLQKVIEETKSEIKNKNDKNTLTKNEEITLQKEIEDNKEEIKTMQGKIKKLKADILKKENKGKKGKIIKEIEQNERELFKITEEKNKLCVQLQDHENLNTRKNNLMSKKERYMGSKEIEREITEIRDFIDLGYNDLNELNNDIKETEIELNKQLNKLGEVQKHDAASAKENQISRLFKNVEGFLGRLGSLGTVEDELVVAISAVAKNALNNIVVNNTETAEECIRILKRNNIERTTFIILDKMREYKLDGKHNYLMKHIKCEETYLKAFYFVFSDTILCENITEAKKIAMGEVARKVVTKDGKMIDKSGLMSGGGEYIRTTKMTGSKKHDIETNVNKLRKALGVMFDGKKKTLEKIAHLKQQRNEIEQEHEDMDINAIERELKELDKNLLEHEKNNKEIQNKLKMNDKLALDYEKKLDELAQKLEDNDDIETKRMKGEISIMFENLTLFESRNKNLSERLMNITLYDLTALKKNLSVNEEEIKKLKIPLNYDDLKKQVTKEEVVLKELIKKSDIISDEIIQLKNKIGNDFNKEIDHKNLIDDNTSKILSNKSEVNNLKNTNKTLFEEFSKYKMHHKKTIIISYEDIDDYDEINGLLESKLRSIKKLEFIEGSALNMKIFDDYKSKKKEYEQCKIDYDQFKERMDLTKIELENLTNKKQTEFMAGLSEINKNLKEIYQLLTFGGNAELEMNDPIDPFAEGISLSVMPPKKSWKNVSMLSGGEKTISSLALVFALHIYKPSPFYVMDEIDAALDFKNVSIIANYILEKAKDSQFLIVSLRNNMFELSDTLLGIYKNDGLSKTMMFDIKEMNKKIIK